MSRDSAVALQQGSPAARAAPDDGNTVLWRVHRRHFAGDAVERQGVPRAQDVSATGPAAVGQSTACTIRTP